MLGPESVNGTYDQVVFTQRAVQYIHDSATQQTKAMALNQQAKPLFLFVAYHNVHGTHMCCHLDSNISVRISWF